MTEIDYLRKHPLDFTIEDGAARVRLFVCPEAGDCGDHPVLQLHEPADTPDEDASARAFKNVTGALSYMLHLSTTIVAIEAVADIPDADFQRGGFEIAAAAAEFHNQMAAAIKRSTLN